MSPRTIFNYLSLLCLAFTLSCERQSSSNTKEENEIRQTVAAYVDTFNRHDAAALAGFWADDASYVNPETGKTISGKEEIQKQFEEIFNDDTDETMTIEIDSVAFPHPNKAVESGVVTVESSDGSISKQAYRVFYEKINGKWLIQQAREVDVDLTPEENENLKELSWLIGEWIDEDDDSVNAINTSWDKYKNFIVQSFTVSVEGFLELEGKQLIAWDPIKRKIRSWVFDSDGSFGEGFWSKEGKNWVADMSQTMSDGKKGSATYIYTPLDDGSYTWQATDREVGGDILPDIEPVTVKRKAG